MKVLIPVINQQEARNVLAESFHNAESVCIFDFSTQEHQWIKTKTLLGEFANLAESLKSMGINAVVSKSMPLMALGFFTDSAMPVYKAIGDNLDENLTFFKDSSLEQMTNSMVKDMSKCGSSCSSCSSTSCN